MIASNPGTLETTSRLIPVGPAATADRARWLCEQLESGHILFFAETPFELAQADREFLLSQRQTDAGYHKNVAYRPHEDRLTGSGRASEEDKQRLRAILRDYSDHATRFLAELLPAYGQSWRRDFASFRPLEERGRKLRLRARNDLLHTDAFPTRPTRGDRILRIFTNLNPSEPRVWITSETFESLAQRFARAAGLPRPTASGLAPRLLTALARTFGVKTPDRSPYDQFMLRFHNFLKENGEFQRTCTKQRWEFPPGSTWVVFTDVVSHAVLAGQFALEQTFIVSRKALALPHKAPIHILEKLCGCALTSG